MPKATAVFDADDSRFSAALARINGRMLALQSRIAKFAAAFIAHRAVAGVVTAGFDHFKQALDVGGQLNDLSSLPLVFARPFHGFLFGHTSVSFAQPPVALKQSVAAMPFAHRNAELEHAFCRRAAGSSRTGSPPRARWAGSCFTKPAF